MFLDNRDCSTCRGSENYETECNCKKIKNMWRSKTHLFNKYLTGFDCNQCVHWEISKGIKYPCNKCYIMYTGWRPDLNIHHLKQNLRKELWSGSLTYWLWSKFQKKLK